MTRYTESEIQDLDPDLLWIYDKLIISKKMNYNCGPVGIDVPTPGPYIVRPVMNFLGLGLGAAKYQLVKSTDFLPAGYFWCEFFEGRHLSVDYYHGKQVLCVEGFKDSKTFIKWDKWQEVEDQIPFPSILKQFKTFPIVNCEFINGNLIEVQLRPNNDFRWGNKEYIPVWDKQDIRIPEGYKYVQDPDLHGRVGAFIR